MQVSAPGPQKRKTGLPHFLSNAFPTPVKRVKDGSPQQNLDVMALLQPRNPLPHKQPCLPTGPHQVGSLPLHDAEQPQLPLTACSSVLRLFGVCIIEKVYEIF